MSVTAVFNFHLFTSAAHNKIKIKNLSKKMGVPITCIGEITETPKNIIVLDSSNKKMKIKNSGYRHF